MIPPHKKKCFLNFLSQLIELCEAKLEKARPSWCAFFYNKLRQRRTIVPASLSRLFAPLLQFEKWEIHTVFLHFSNFELGQKSWLSLLVKLCGVALTTQLALAICEKNKNRKIFRKGRCCWLKYEVPIWEKANLTFEEAAAYFGIGINRLRDLASNDYCPYVWWIGSKRLIKRRAFERYLETAFSVWY